ncbi:MAG: hypothetical protein A3H91_13000 [Gammaproteobacteria bacterium RIFCSPLOWO2_02_FULL_61_13]|nr:MAG: hypothetical protein A3H91_13000 [Gammaproteobacteria bacterium RIFCSPLOWO2_02_FULL_61_13]
MARVTVMAVNIEQIMPSESVTANPLIGPVPMANRNNAEIRVVILESQMVMKARSYPAWMLACGEFPLRSSSRMRS